MFDVRQLEQCFLQTQNAYDRIYWICQLHVMHSGFCQGNALLGVTDQAGKWESTSPVVLAVSHPWPFLYS